MEVKKITEGMTAPQVAQVIDDNFKAQNAILEEDIAKQNNVIGVSEYKDFSEAEAVSVGDVRNYNGLLYECVEATTGAFNAAKWKKSSFKAETEKKISDLEEKTETKLSELGSEVAILLGRKIVYSGMTMSGTTGFLVAATSEFNGFLCEVEGLRKYRFIGLPKLYNKISCYSAKPRIGGNSDIFLGAADVNDNNEFITLEGTKYVCTPAIQISENESEKDDYLLKIVSITEEIKEDILHLESEVKREVTEIKTQIVELLGKKLTYSGMAMSGTTGFLVAATSEFNGFVCKVKGGKKYKFLGLPKLYNKICCYSEKPSIGNNSSIFLGVADVSEENEFTAIEDSKYVCTPSILLAENLSIDDDYLLELEGVLDDIEEKVSLIDSRLNQKADIAHISETESVSLLNNININETETTQDNNWISSNFISLAEVESFEYYLASMEGATAISFYTDEDFSKQITSANINGTTPIGTSGILQGVINKSDFPSEAKYVVFCSVNPKSSYYNGGVSVSLLKSVVRRNNDKLNNLIMCGVEDVPMGVVGNLTENGFTSDTNYIRTEFVNLEGVRGISYHLGGMTNVISVAFYREMDYNTQLSGYNIIGTAPIGTAKTIEGYIDNFPSEAKYVILCGVVGGNYYKEDGINSVRIVKMSQNHTATNVLYSKHFSQGTNINSWVGVSTDKVSDDGLLVDTNGCVLYLEYGLAQRTLNICCKFNADSVAQITSYPTKDSMLVIDCKAKTFNLNNLHEVSFPFFNAEHDYNIEIIRDYQSMKVVLTDMISGDIAEYDYINNGTGGIGGGEVGTASLTGEFHDFYQFVTSEGAFYIKDVKVLVPSINYNAIFYGDSITEQDAYFSTETFEKSWIKRALSKMKGIASGRGGGNISGVLGRIKNELPYIRAKYVVVTIGTNGGNTEDNLSQLVEYIKSQGATPILNHIPCNESGTQVSVNAIIDAVRAKYKIKGADFDLCTSLNGDGKQVNTDTMFWENYSSTNNIYHHPNEKGGATMFAKLMQDVPEIFVI